MGRLKASLVGWECSSFFYLITGLELRFLHVIYTASLYRAWCCLPGHQMHWCPLLEWCVSDAFYEWRLYTLCMNDMRPDTSRDCLISVLDPDAIVFISHSLQIFQPWSRAKPKLFKRAAAKPCTSNENGQLPIENREWHTWWRVLRITRLFFFVHRQDKLGQICHIPPNIAGLSVISYKQTWSNWWITLSGEPISLHRHSSDNQTRQKATSQAKGL